MLEDVTSFFVVSGLSLLSTSRFGLSLKSLALRFLLEFDSIDNTGIGTKHKLWGRPFFRVLKSEVHLINIGWGELWFTEGLRDPVLSELSCIIV